MANHNHVNHIQIDSNLIKETNSLPDELKQLGVSAYNENEFEKGVMLQYDLQLAKYELDQCESRLKVFGGGKSVDLDKIDDNSQELSSNNNDNSNDSQSNSSIKRKKQDKFFDTVKNYKEKKARLESKLEDFHNYLDNTDNTDTVRPSTSGLSTANSNNNNETAENMIKSGEMTPFGSVLGTNESKVVSSSSKIKPSTSKPKSFAQTKITDFEQFLLGLDKSKAKAKKANKKQEKISQQARTTSLEITNRANTTTQSQPITEFEKYLLDLDKKTDEKSKLTKKSSKKIEKTKSLPNDKTSSNKVVSNAVEEKLTDFDKFFMDLDDKQTEKSKTSKTKQNNKEATKKEKTSKDVVAPKKISKNDLTKFVNEIEEDEEPEVVETKRRSRGRSERFRKSLEKIKLNEKTIDLENEEEEEDLDELDDGDDDYEPSNDDSQDYSEMDYREEVEDDDINDDYSDVDGEGSVYYTTDSDDDDDVEGGSGKKKRKNKRIDLDDGNEKIFQKRMKKLDKLEKNGELFDLNEYTELEGGLRVPQHIWNRLYKFQKTGVKWLWELHLQRCGGILGDEMGLGKTIQTIAFLASIKYSKIRNTEFPYIGLGPTLIVTPTTLMSNWIHEFHEWWPFFRVAILHDIGTYKQSPKHQLIDKIVACNGILITTYSSLLIYEKYLMTHNWHYVILDEGHKIRNPNAKITITTKCFRTPHRIILSGSPIQNNLKELWSLFDFIFPGKLGTLMSFMENFSVPIVQGGYSNASETQIQTAFKCATVLKDTITPYLLRRMKADIQHTLDLPTKNEQVLFCRLCDEQKDEYLEYIKSKECTKVLNNYMNVFKALMHLRKICNHADLVTNAYYDEKSQVERYNYGYYKRSGKMLVVETLLKLWKKQENRVLLFTQSRKMIDIFESFMKSQNYEYLKMDGTTPAGLRASLVNRFNNDTNVFIFLLTTKVGGIGLNLIVANHIIIYDPDWNPSTDMQARERAWRIGQTKSVTIYRLLTAGTIEEKIYHRQIFKQFLTNKVLKDPRQKRFFKTNDLYELFSYGSLDGNAGVESTSLFAGTGSEVKKPPKYAKMDGERIPYLMKNIDGSKKTNTDEQESANNRLIEDKHKDDYVLSKLFKVKKNGYSKICTALKHDAIVDDTQPDFALVEAEAEKVASEALQSLKESRRLCNSAESGLPNLVGVKFGSNSKLGNDRITKSNTNDDQDITTQPITTSGPSASGSIMNRIKMRKNLTDSNNNNPTDKMANLANQIREYLKHGTTKYGEASTQEIVEYFQDKIETTESVKFKALLKNLCTFHRTASSVGFWKLKEEFDV